MPLEDKLAKLKEEFRRFSFVDWKDVEVSGGKQNIYFKTRASTGDEVQAVQFAKDLIRAASADGVIFDGDSGLGNLSTYLSAQVKKDDHDSTSACKSVYDALKKDGVKDEQIEGLKTLYNQAFFSLFLRILQARMMATYEGCTVKANSRLTLKKDAEGYLLITVTEDNFKVTLAAMPGEGGQKERTLDVPGSIETTFKIDSQSLIEGTRVSRGFEIVGFKADGQVGDFILQQETVEKFGRDEGLINIAKEVAKNVTDVQERRETVLQDNFDRAMKAASPKIYKLHEGLGTAREKQVAEGIGYLVGKVNLAGFLEKLAAECDSSDDSRAAAIKKGLISMFKAPKAGDRWEEKVTRFELVEGATEKMYRFADLILPIAENDVQGKNEDSAKYAAEAAVGFACYLKVPRDLNNLTKALRVLLDYQLRNITTPPLGYRQNTGESSKEYKLRWLRNKYNLPISEMGSCVFSGGLAEFLVNRGKKPQMHFEGDYTSADVADILKSDVKLCKAMSSIVAKIFRAYPTMSDAYKSSPEGKALIEFVAGVLRDSLNKTVDICDYQGRGSSEKSVHGFNYFSELMRVLGLEEKEWSMALSMLPQEQCLELFRAGISNFAKGEDKILRPLIDAKPSLVRIPPLGVKEWALGNYLVACNCAAVGDMESAISYLTEFSVVLKEASRDPKTDREFQFSGADLNMLQKMTVSNWYLLLKAAQNESKLPVWFKGIQIKSYVSELECLFGCYDRTIAEAFAAKGSTASRSAIFQSLNELVKNKTFTWADKKSAVELVVEKIWEASGLADANNLDVSRVFIPDLGALNEILLDQNYSSLAKECREHLEQMKEYASLCDPSVVATKNDWQKTLKQVKGDRRIIIMLHAWQQACVAKNDAAKRKIIDAAGTDLNYLTDELVKPAVRSVSVSSTSFIAALLRYNQNFTTKVILEDKYRPILELSHLSVADIASAAVDFISDKLHAQIFTADHSSLPFSALALRWVMEADPKKVAVSDVEKGVLALQTPDVCKNILEKDEWSYEEMDVISKRVLALFSNDKSKQVQSLAYVFDYFFTFLNALEVVATWLNENGDFAVEAFYFWAKSAPAESITRFFSYVVDKPEFSQLRSELIAKVTNDKNSSWALDILLGLHGVELVQTVLAPRAGEKVSSSISLTEVGKLFSLLKSEEISETELDKLFNVLNTLRFKASVLQVTALDPALFGVISEGSVGHDNHVLIDLLCKKSFTTTNTQVTGKGIEGMMVGWFTASNIKDVLKFVLKDAEQGSAGLVITDGVKQIAREHALEYMARSSALPGDIDEILKLPGMFDTCVPYFVKGWTEPLNERHAALLGRILQNYPVDCYNKWLEKMKTDSKKHAELGDTLVRIFQSVGEAERVKVGASLCTELLKQISSSESGAAAFPQDVAEYARILGKLMNVPEFPFAKIIKQEMLSRWLKGNIQISDELGDILVRKFQSVGEADRGRVGTILCTELLEQISSTSGVPSDDAAKYARILGKLMSVPEFPFAKIINQQMLSKWLKENSQTSDELDGVLVKIFQSIAEKERGDVGALLCAALLERIFTTSGAPSDDAAKYARILGKLMSMSEFPFADVISQEKFSTAKGKIAFIALCFGESRLALPIVNTYAANLDTSLYAISNLTVAASYAKTFPINSAMIGRVLQCSATVRFSPITVKVVNADADGTPGMGEIVVQKVSKGAKFLGITYGGSCQLRYKENNEVKLLELNGSLARRIYALDGEIPKVLIGKISKNKKLKKWMETERKTRSENQTAPNFVFDFVCNALQNPSLQMSNLDEGSVRQFETIIEELAARNRALKSPSGGGGWRQLLKPEFLDKVKNLDEFATNLKAILKNNFGVGRIKRRSVDSAVKQAKARRPDPDILENICIAEHHASDKLETKKQGQPVDIDWKVMMCATSAQRAAITATYYIGIMTRIAAFFGRLIKAKAIQIARTAHNGPSVTAPNIPAPGKTTSTTHRVVRNATGEQASATATGKPRAGMTPGEAYQAAQGRDQQEAETSSTTPKMKT